MKKRYFILLSLIWLSLSSTMLRAADEKTNSIRISGTSDSATNVEVLVYMDFYLAERKNYSLYTVGIVDKKFLFTQTCYGHPFYITVRFMKGAREIGSIGNFLVQGGDSIHINQTPGVMQFSGKSAASFRCQYLLRQIKPLAKLVNFDLVPDLYAYIINSNHIWDSVYAMKQSVLSVYRDSMPKQLYEVVKADVISERAYFAYVSADSRLAGLRKDTIRQRRVIEYYMDSLLNKPVVEPGSNRAFLYSSAYMDYILLKTRMEVRIHDAGFRPVFDRRDGASPRDIRLLEKIRSKDLREKLLAAFFIRLSSINDSLAFYLRKVKKRTDSKFLRNALNEVERRTNGMPAYDFSLPDSTGKIISLKDFRGKTVFVDFWYTGCIWCAVLKKDMHSLLEAKDSSVVYITVSIDTDRNRWKESIRSGLYTTDNEVNLVTAGEGIEHPIISYYGINSFPYILIITPGGKISSINPATTAIGQMKVAKITEAIAVARKQD